MEIDRIREFIGFSKTGDPTQTARDFSITPAVLTKHIASLERELGTSLVLRTQFGTSLTRAGIRFAEDARSIIDEYDSAIDRIQRRKSATNTTIVVGYLAAASKPVLPGAVRAFSDRHPDVVLEFLSLEVDEIFETLCDGRIDVGITSSLELLADKESCAQRFSWEKLYSDRFVLLMREDHPLANRERISVSDLAGEKILLTVPEFMENDPRITRLLEPIIDSIELCDAAYDLDAALVLMRSGNRIALSLEHIKSILGAGFAFVPIEEAESIQLEIGVLWRNGDTSALVAELADDLRMQAESRMA